MPFIISGRKGIEQVHHRGRFPCPSCEAERGYDHVKVKSYFTLYFVPLFPVGTEAEFVRCEVCGTTYDPAVLDGGGGGPIDVFAAPGEDAHRAPRRTGADPELGVMFERAYRLVSDNLGTLAPVIGALFVLGLVSMGFGVAIAVVGVENPEMQLNAQLASYPINFVITLVQVFLQLGLIRMVLALDRGEEADTEMLFEQSANYGRGLLVFIGLMLIVGLGTVACLVPGIFLSIALSFVLILVVDTDLSATEVFGTSWELTDGFKGFILLQILILFIPACFLYCFTCGVGIPVATVFYTVLQCVTYNAIRQSKGL